MDTNLQSDGSSNHIELLVAYIHFDCMHEMGRERSVEPMLILEVHCKHWEVAALEWPVAVDSGGSTERSLDDYSALRTAMNHPFDHPTHEDSDKDVAGDYNGQHDENEGACGYDDVDMRYEKSVGFQPYADSTGAWNVFDLDVTIPLVDTKTLEGDGDYHQTRSW